MTLDEKVHGLRRRCQGGLPRGQGGILISWGSPPKLQPRAKPAEHLRAQICAQRPVSDHS